MALQRIWNYLLRQYEVRLQPRVNSYWRRVEPYYEGSKSVLLHATVAFVIVSSCLYISAFLFGVVYYYNMPTTYHSFDLNFQYNRKCIQQHRNYIKNGVLDSHLYEKNCYPRAEIYFDDPSTSRKRVDANQPYRVYMSLEVPESETNLNIGMFMTTMKYAKKEASYPASLRYRPMLVRLGYMAVFWPLFLFEFMETKQVLDIPLFQNIVFSYPTATEIEACKQSTHQYQRGEMSKEYCRRITTHQRVAEILIDYPDIEIYSAHLHLTATFSGLQYFLFQWPVFSLLVGTAIFFVPVLSSVLVLLYFFISKLVRENGRDLPHVGGDNAASSGNSGEENDPSAATNGRTETREEGGDKENDDSPHPSTASSTSSSIEMIGSPSLDGTTDKKPLGIPDSSSMLFQDGDGEGTSPEMTTTENDGNSLRKRK